MTSFGRSGLPPGVRPGGRFAEWRAQPVSYVVADVDGTLVGVDPRASVEVADAVRDATRAGIRVGFATGRMRLAVDRLWEQLRAPGPHVLHNGAEVRADGRTVASWPLERAHLEAVFAIARSLSAYVEIYVESGFLVTDRRQEARPHWNLLGHEPLGIVTSADEVDGEVAKVTFAVFDRGDPQPIVAALRDAGMAAGPAGSPLTPDITYVNGTRPDADKGNALRAAASHLELELGAVAAIGDAANDLPMLGPAGTAIAMGQASAEVKDNAHLIVPEVAEHGAATALRFLASESPGGLRSLA